jgi:hypothetical protein
MPGYSGSTRFSFEIERYRNRVTGVMYTEEEADAEDGFEYQVLQLSVEGTAYYQPGKTYGPPEDCYPAEDDVELTSVVDMEGKDWKDRLTKSETDVMQVMVIDLIQMGQEDPDDYDDEPHSFY